jgi:hypothetical protein
MPRAIMLPPLWLIIAGRVRTTPSGGDARATALTPRKITGASRA